MPNAGALLRGSDQKVIDTGTVAVTVSAGGSFFSTAVLFAQTFTAAPKVAVGVKQGSSGATAVVGGVVDTVTATGFTVYVRAGDDGNFGGGAVYNVDWIAVGS